MYESESSHRWLYTGVALVAACGAGYGIAKLTNRSTVQEATPAAPAATTSNGQLALPESFLTMMDITLETVAPGNLGAEIQAPATVTNAANGQAVVTSRAAGTVVRLNKRLGDQVKTGEVLALVESRDAAAMAAELMTAEAKVQLAQSTLKREQSLFDQKVTPRQDLENAQAQLVAAQAEAARAKSAAQAAGVAEDGRSLAVISPISGRITSANVALGIYVEPQMELFRVADPRFVLIEAAVPSVDASRVSVGDAAQVTTANGAILSAEVVSVTPTVSEQTRAATVTLTLASGQRMPAPGEFVQVQITPKTSGAAGFVLPEEAVQVIDGRDAVFVRTDEGFKVATLVVGSRSAGRVQVLSGLTAGQRIAAKNAFLLKAELNKGAEEEE